jgi:hypothetical protein
MDESFICGIREMTFLSLVVHKLFHLWGVFPLRDFELEYRKNNFSSYDKHLSLRQIHSKMEWVIGSYNKSPSPMKG